MKLDAHHHCWRYRPEEYAWIDDSMAVIRHDFGPDDLALLLAAAGVEGTVAVEARSSVDETDQLLELARRHAFIQGVVGWAPIGDPQLGALLDRWRHEPALKGVRQVLQGGPDEFMATPAFNAGLEAVAARGLSFDLCVKAPQLPAVIALVDRHPNLSFVLDHIGKPVVAGPPPPAWRRDLAELARRPHVCCKFSGVATEAPGYAWKSELARSYFDVALESFGARRLMFGSDWPVCQVATDYVAWYQTVAGCVTALSPTEREQVLGGTATRVYRLPA